MTSSPTEPTESTEPGGPEPVASELAMRFGRIRTFSTLDSTNRWVADAARQGEADGLVAVARQQTAGRGRLDRRWVAPPDSALLCSVLVRPNGPVANWQLLTIAMALAAQDATRAFGCDEVLLKWPNDLMVHGRDDLPNRKFAGILAEAITASPPTQQGAVVVGIGCNLRRPPQIDPEIAGRAVWLDELISNVPSAETFLAALLEKFSERVRVLEEAPAHLVDDYRSRCVTIDARVRIDLGDHSMLGRATGIDETGQLLVLADGEMEPRTLAVGDVVHLRSLD